MIDTNALRKKVLDLAIRGKLVPQDPNDEPASVLLERIRTEKQRLIKEGKIKKDKGDSIIFKGDDNCHYEKIGETVKKIDLDLPANWELCHLSLICWLNNGEKTTGEKLPYLDARTLRGKNEGAYLESGIIVNAGDKVILVDGENSGEVFVVPYRGYMGSTFKILQMISNINVEYIKIILDFYRETLKESKTGAAIPHLNKQLLKSIIIGIPPIEEQNKIVLQVEKIMHYIDLLEQNQADYDSLVATLKKAVLQSAIQGKLVEQDPTDEPASVLLEHIRAEKKKQLGKKYIESYIYKGDDNCYYEHINGQDINISDDIPFDLPENWCWCKLESICAKDIKRGKAPKYSESGEILVFAQKCNTKKGGIDLELAKKLEPLTIKKYEYNDFMQDGDIVINSTGTGTLGRVGIYSKLDNPKNRLIVPDSHVTIIRLQNISPYYVYLYLKGKQQFFESIGEGSTNQKELSPDIIKKVFVPIPPLAEQQRIVEKINEIFAKL